MINFIKSLLGLGPKINFKQLVDEGAMIVDVRTPSEFAQGHIRQSVNIPVDRISSELDKLRKKNKPVITVCRSGNRSGMAKSILSKNGIEAYNGGPWNSLEQKIR